MLTQKEKIYIYIHNWIQKFRYLNEYDGCVGCPSACDRLAAVHHPVRVPARLPGRSRGGVPGIQGRHTSRHLARLPECGIQVLWY